MSKPTLVQSLLNQPSKSYANADSNRRKEYYSTRQEMVRLAGQKPVDGIGNTGGTQPEGVPRYQHDKAGAKATDRREPVMTRGPAPAVVLNHPRRPSSKILEPDDDSDSEVDMFFTPNTSPRASMASSVATITFPSSGRRPSRRSLGSLKSVDSSPAAAAHVPADAPGAAVKAATTATATATRTPSANARNALSTASSLSSTSLDGHSIFSADYTATTTEYYISDQTVPIGRGTPVRSTSTRTPPGGAKAGTYSHLGVAATNNHAKTNGHSTTGKERAVPAQENVQTKLKGKGKEVPRPLPDHVKLDPSKNSVSTSKHTNASAPAARQQQQQSTRHPQTFSPFAPINSSSTSPANSTSSAVPKHQPLPPNQHRPTSPSNAAKPPYPRPESSSASSTSTRTVRPASNINDRHGSAPVRNTAPRPSPPQPIPTPTSSTSKDHTPRRVVESPSPPSSPSPSPLPPPSTQHQHQQQQQQQQYLQRSNHNPHQPDYSYSYVPAVVIPQSQMQMQMPTITPLIRGMDAVLEEDEDGPLTPRMEAQTLRGQADRDRDGWDWDGGAASQPESSSGTPPTTSVSATGSGRLRHTTPRKKNNGNGNNNNNYNNSNNNNARPLSGDSASSSSSSLARSAAATGPQPKTLSAEVHALVSGFADADGARPSNGTQGYTALVLPRAPPPANGGGGGGGGGGMRGLLYRDKEHMHMYRDKREKELMMKEGRVDLTRAGVAQVTMATVEVVRGLGATAGGGGGVLGFLGLGLGLGRRRSSRDSGRAKAKAWRGPAPIPIPGLVVPDAAAAAHDADNNNNKITGLRYSEPMAGETPLGFTAYRAPPTHVPSAGVLVQVWAVGVDSVDGRLVGARFGNHYLREGVGVLGGDLELVEDEEMEEVDGAGGGGGDGDGDGDHEDVDDGRYVAAHENGNGQGQGHVTDGEDEGDVPSTATVGSSLSFSVGHSPAKKGALAALGRSLSLRLSRGQSKKKNKDLQRSVSAAATAARANAPAASPPRQQAQQNGSGGGGGIARPSPPRAQTSIDLSTISRPKRSFSLKRSNTATSNASSITASASPAKKDGGGLKRTESVLVKKEKAYAPDVGYIPGRSFVGRVLECGWEVPDEAVKKGEWVIGLLDVRKGGALAEFIVVDRHRVHRVPHPRPTADISSPATATSPPVWTAAPRTANGTPRAPTLTLEELALLPLCGLPAQRAVRTLDFAFSTMDNAATALHRPQYEFGNGLASPSVAERRRALVLRGHDGAGAMAVQILVKRGWRVSVHVPYALVPANAPKAALEATTHAMEDRAREWGADEVIFDDGEGLLDDGRGAAVRVLEAIRADGDVFDAVVDPIGGKEVWEAAERLLKFPGGGGGGGGGVPPAPARRRGVGQFTTLAGDWPDRVVPRAKDHLRSGLRAMRMGSADSAHHHAGEEGKVGYAWVCVAQDVDWEGNGVAETLGAVIRLALEEGVRPPVDDVVGQMGYRRRVVPFEQSPQAFVDNGLLGNGGTVVVKIAG